MILVTLLLKPTSSLSRNAWRVLFTGNRPDYPVIFSVIGCAGLVLLVVLTIYYQLDYKRHRKPLALEDPNVRYGLLHHAKAVFVPKALYYKKRVLLWSGYTTILLTLLVTAVVLQLRQTYAFTPVSVETRTNVATSQQTSELRGEITSGWTPNIDYITERGFEYGTTTGYGSTKQAGIIPKYVFGQKIGTMLDGYGALDPVALARDNSGYIYVAAGYSRVVKLNPDYTYNSHWGCGPPEDSPIDCTEVYTQLATDGSGHLYSLSSGKITRSNTDGSSPLDWSVSGVSVESAAQDIAVEADGNVLVVFHDKLVRYSPVGAVIDELPLHFGDVYDDATSVAIGADQSIYVKYFLQAKVKKIAPDGAETFLDTGYVTARGSFVIDSNDNLWLGTARTVLSQGIWVSDIGVDVEDTVALPDGSLLAIKDSSPSGIYRYAPLYQDEEYRADISGLTCNTTYHYRAYVETLDNTVYGEDKALTTKPCNFTSATTQTTSASDITDDGSTLNGSVTGDIGYSIGETYFEYGATNSYGERIGSGALGQTPTHASSFGSSGTGNGQFNGASRMAIDSNGNVYVADMGNSRIQKFSATGTYILQWGTSGTGNGQFNGISAIGIDGQDNVFVADATNRIQQFDSQGSFIQSIGSTGSGEDQFDGITAIVFGPYSANQDRVYIADCGNNRIQSYRNFGNVLDLNDSDAGYYKRQSFGSIGSAGTGDGQFNCPKSITINNGSVYVLDSGNSRVQVLNDSGSFLESYTIDDQQLVTPIGLAHGMGTIFMGDTASPKLQRLEGEGAGLGVVASWGSAGSGPGQFGQISDVISNAKGDVLYVADSSLNRIQRFTVSTNVGSFSEAIKELTCNTTYHYQFFSRTRYESLINSPGTGGDDQTFTTATCPPPPTLTVQTNSAGSVSLDGATLSGQITDIGQGNVTSVGFDYGTTTSYGQYVSASNGPYGTTSFDLELSQLECGTTYHYQAWANNDQGKVTGSDHQFTTSVCPIFDLSLSQRLLTTPPITAGKEISFRVTIKNLGPDVWGSDSTLIVTLPAGVTYQSVSSPFQCVDTRTMVPDGETYEDSYYGRHYPGHTTVLCSGATSQYEVASQGVFEVDVTGTATQAFVSGTSLNRALIVENDNYERPIIDFQSVFQQDGDFWTVNTNNISRWTYSYTPGTTPPVEPPTPPIQPPMKPTATPPTTITTTPPTVAEAFTPEAIQKLQAGGVLDRLPGKTATVSTSRASARLFSGFFMSLLLLLALAYAVQAWREYRFARNAQRAIAAAKRRASMTQQFLEIITHYLNTPLAILQGAHELMTSKHTFDGTFLTSFGLKLTALRTTVQGFEGSVEASLVQGGQSSFADSDQKLLQIARTLWTSLLGIAVAIASIDLALLLTGAYEKRGGRLVNSILLAIFSALLIGVLYVYHKRSKVLHTDIDQELVNTRMLAKQKEELLLSVAPSLQHHTDQLTQGTEGMAQFADAHLLVNGLNILQKLTQELTSYHRLTQTDPAGSVDVANYYKQSIEPAVQALAQEKGSILQSAVSGGLHVPLRSDQLDYILSATIGNAIEYSPSGSKVVVQAQNRGNKTNIEVTDNGPGLNPEALKGIFEPLQRGTDTQTFDHQGLGLGLFVVKHIIEQCGGTIVIDSKIGAGTAIKIRLPQFQGEVGNHNGYLIKPSIQSLN